MKRMDNIEILPMACVGLLLVLMMMIVAPMVMTHIRTPIDVPQAHTAEAKTEENLTITYTLNNRLLINDKEISNENLADEVTKELVNDPFILVVVRADKGVLHKDVLEILATVKQCGAKRIACATKQPKGE